MNKYQPSFVPLDHPIIQSLSSLQKPTCSFDREPGREVSGDNDFPRDKRRN